MKNKIFAGIVLVSVWLCLFQPIFADSNMIIISDKEDLLKFSENCTLDTWSQGKNVSLTCDIDMENEEFPSIPTFGGTFDGNGYTISGVKLSKSGSNLGFFRYIQKGGKVTNINVKGEFVPGGSKSFIGGIVGENAGVIEQCGFEGNVKGENVIGGIVGKNTESGQIISCNVSGNVSGENHTGGIAGENEGLILSCVNDAEVNTVYEEKKKELSDIDTDAGAIVESYKTNKEENEEESVLGHTDTGGIVGYTSGVVQGCVNNAHIGYQHIGYNVGGIAGRQSGYILGCKNYGLIQGRKDVGGIAGQMEPYIMLELSESSLKDIRRELNNLHSMIDRFITDSDDLGEDAQRCLTKISDHSKNAQDNTEKLLNIGTDFVDDNLSEINAKTAIISNTIDKLVPVFESLGSSGDDVSASLDAAVSALESVELYIPELSDEIKDISEAVNNISNAGVHLNRSLGRVERALDALDDAVELNNKTQVKNAVSELSSAVEDIITAKMTIKTSLETIENILKTKPENFESIGINAKEIAEQIKNIKENTDKTITALQTAGKSIDTLIVNTDIDFYSFKYAAQHMALAANYMGDAMNDISVGLRTLSDALPKVYDKLDDYGNDMSGQLNTAKDNLSDSLNSLSYAVDDIKSAVDDMTQIISDLSEEAPLEFVTLGDDFKTASEDLFDSVSDISSGIDELKNTLSDGMDKITGNIREISKQFNVVMNLMIGELESLQNSDGSLSDIFLDVSDEDIESSKQGKVEDCQNSGKVEGDRNSGGIAGSMAIDYSKDPEDDIEKPNTLNFTYKTKAILQACINEGEITGKKDCVGGIVGLSEIGTVFKCENYGDAESTGGDYIGGIAGKSETIVRKCYSKCKLSGKRYVGGIAGKTDSISSCYSIVNVEGDEGIGAICGVCDNREKIYKNFFVQREIGAVDGISYKDAAEPVSYDELKEMPGIPKRFISFAVTFTADDEIIEIQEIAYGSDTERIRYPQIPEKEGHFGNWQKPEAETVTENIEIACEYKPYITILSSIEKNDNGKLALALAEGEFTDKAELHIRQSSKTPPKKAYGHVDVYDVSLDFTDVGDNDNVTLRILNENRDKVTAWYMKDGQWQETTVKTRGKYVILNTTGTSNVVCLQYNKKGFSILWILPIIILLLAALVIIIIKKKRKKH